jgi:hypothetical protein
MLPAANPTKLASGKSQHQHCDKCKRRMNVEFAVPDNVWQTVVLNRWRALCPQCF